MELRCFFNCAHIMGLIDLIALIFGTLLACLLFVIFFKFQKYPMLINNLFCLQVIGITEIAPWIPHLRCRTNTKVWKGFTVTLEKGHEWLLSSSRAAFK